MVDPPDVLGEHLAKLEAGWTRLEARLCAGVLVANVAALCLWVFLSGLSAEGNAAGVVFRAFAGATVLGLITHKLTKKRKPIEHSGLVTAAVILGLVTAKLWSHVFVSYASNVLNWMQNASVFMLFGGLRTPGVATRLTLWLALLGASIATSQGKHINVDVMMRFLTPKMRVPVALVGWLAAAMMCVAASWGFFDHIAIQSFHVPRDKACGEARCDLTLGEKWDIVAHGAGNDLFLVGRQMSLDLKTLPHVITGDRYDQYMHAAEWNAWMKGADWKAHYKAEDVQAQLVPEDMPDTTKMPAVTVPGATEDARGILTKDIDFVFVFGLVVIALKFVLRGLLVLAGKATVDPDAAHADDEVAQMHEAPTVPPPGDAG